ncbi:hypothetical protein GCM10018954_084300 [Kutzneria kofuensis]
MLRGNGSRPSVGHMATEPKTLTPPPAILGAFGLWLVSTALGVVTAILVLTEKDTLVAGIRRPAAR